MSHDAHDVILYALALLSKQIQRLETDSEDENLMT